MEPQQPSDTILEERIRYKFKNESLLRRALTHRSYVNEVGEATTHNQRLEYLGDAVISLIIATKLFFTYPDLREGHLSATRASLVSDCTLAEIARGISLGQHLRLGWGEVISGGREKTSILADAYEALVGAIYLDGGFEEARRVVLSLHKTDLDSIEPKSLAATDFKSQLQRLVQITYFCLPTYEIIEREGPLHKPTYTATVSVGDEVVAYGTGPNIKGAHQLAARNALEFFESGGELKEIPVKKEEGEEELPEESS